MRYVSVYLHDGPLSYILVYCTSEQLVSIASDYGLDKRVIGVRSPAEVKDFSSSLCVQTCCGPTQPPIQWVPEVLYQWAKHSRGVTLTTHPI
jgi:hypothetical protein